MVVRTSAEGFSSTAGHTSIINNQNQPVFPATPRMGRIAAAKRLENTRAKFKLDLREIGIRGLRLQAWILGNGLTRTETVEWLARQFCRKRKCTGRHRE
jgi:hypothetical protein